VRHRVERVVCPVCKNGFLKSICTGCDGQGEAIILHKPGGSAIEIYPLRDEAKLREQYPDEETPVFERTTLTQAWQTFMQMVEMVHASEIQKREMKRAFFAGAYWMLEMCSVQMDPQSEPTADDLEYLQRIHAEIMQFNEWVQEGKA
jgi:hypothetical protein